MGALRFLGYVCLYLAVGLGLYYVASESVASIFMAVALLLFGGLLILITSSHPSRSKNGRRNNSRRRDTDAEDWLDWIELLEIPFRLIVWIVKSIAKIFD